MAITNSTVRPTHIAFLVARRYLATKTSPRGNTFTGNIGDAVVYVSKLRKQTDDSLYAFTVDSHSFELVAGTTLGAAQTEYNTFISDLITAGLNPIIAS